MKHIFTLLFLLTSASLFAQLGITGSVTYSNYLHGRNTVSQQNGMKSGFNTGVYYKTNYFKPAITYNRHAVRTNFNPGTGARNDWKFRTDYLQFTVPYRFKFGRIFSINAGGYGAYMIGDVGNFVWWNERPRYAWPVSNDWLHMGVRVINRFDYGYVAGLEADLGGLSLIANYQQGLKSVGRRSDKPGAPLQGWMNRQVSAGLEIPFKK